MAAVLMAQTPSPWWAPSSLRPRTAAPWGHWGPPRVDPPAHTQAIKQGAGVTQGCELTQLGHPLTLQLG